MATDDTITRWNVEPFDGDLCARITERPDGPFVRYEDHQRALSAALRERDEARALVKWKHSTWADADTGRCNS